MLIAATARLVATEPVVLIASLREILALLIFPTVGASLVGMKKLYAVKPLAPYNYNRTKWEGQCKSEDRQKAGFPSFFVSWYFDTS
jgi:hypothetical protein